MTFFARVFSLAEDIPSRNAICEVLVEEGYDFSTAPGRTDEDFNEAEWHDFQFSYAEGMPLIMVERNTKTVNGELFKEEIDEFKETIDDAPYTKNTKKVKKIFEDVKQIYAFKLEEEMDEAGWDFIEEILDFICDATDGYVQIDGEGIFDKNGDIMLEFE